MKSKMKLQVLLIWGLLLTLTGFVTTYADGTPKLNFSYYAVQPQTQLDHSKDYFYIQTKPGEKQQLQIELTNTSDEEVRVKMVVKDAISTENGKIAYGDPLIKDETLINPISEIVVPEEKEVTLKGLEKKMVTLNVNPPAEHYDGAKIGAVTLISEDSEKLENMVKVESGYRIAIVTSESGEDFNSGTMLDLIDVKPTLVDGRKVVQAAIQNPEPQSVEAVEIEAEMINAKTKEVVKKTKVSNYAFAPNSTLPFIFDWGLSNLEPGNYQMKMKAKNAQHEWTMEKDFVITGAQASKLNEESPFRIVTPTWMKVTSIALGVVTIIVGIILFIRNKKWRKDVQRSKKRKSRGKRRAKK